MRDPMTVAHEIKSFFKTKDKLFPSGYRETWVTIWHVDPEKDGTDDSCGWFIRSRHGDKEVLEKIIKRFDFDWDMIFKLDKEDHEDCDSGDDFDKVYSRGLFCPDGSPNMSVSSIVLNLFFIAACEHFKVDGNSSWKKARNFMQNNLFDIMFFAENTIDSLRDSVLQTFGNNERREDRIREMALIIYPWILRQQRPWYKHPKWHFWHWKVQVHFVQDLKRWAFSRCCKCGKGFSWGYAPVSDNWNSDGPKWFRSEKGTYHSDCNRPTSNCCATAKQNK